MSSVQYVVALREADLQRLTEISRAFAQEEKEWLAGRRRAHKGLRGGELARARAQLRAELAHERAEGRLIGSRDLLVAQELRQVLAARGWDKAWSAPESGAIGPGRRWGVERDRYLMERGEDEDAGFKGRLATRLPAELGEQLRRACYWHCKDAVEQLQAWADRYGDGPEVILRQAERANDGGIPTTAMLSAAMSKRPNAAAFRERDRLRAEIITTGDLVRDAVARILDRHALPEQTEIPLD
jgi:hypothetical protein